MAGESKGPRKGGPRKGWKAGAAASKRLGLRLTPEQETAYAAAAAEAELSVSMWARQLLDRAAGLDPDD